MSGNPDESHSVLDPAGFPRTSVILSSDRLGWGALAATYYRLPPSELALPPSPEHLVCFHIGHSVRVVERLDGITKERNVVDGEVLIGPPGCPNGEASWDGMVDSLHVRLRPGFVRSVAASLDLPRPERVDAGDPLLLQDAKIERIGLWLVDEMKIGGPGGRLLADSLAFSLAVEMCRAWGLPIRSMAGGRRRLGGAALRRAVDYIRVNLGGDLSLASIALAAGHSPYDFVRLFRRSTGTTPHQFVIRCRVEEAERLLLGGAGSIAAAAHQVGFCDQSHLTRHFKNLRGITPARFIGRSGGRIQVEQDHPIPRATDPHT